MPPSKRSIQPPAKSPTKRRRTRSNPTGESISVEEETRKPKKRGPKRKKQIQDLELENTSLKAELEEVKQRKNCELDKLHRELAIIQSGQRVNMQAAHAFLSTADTVSDADIVGMVKALNYEIHQTAAFCAGTVAYGELSPEDEDFFDLRQIIGNVAYDALSFRKDSENHSNNVQLALQACLVVCCQKVIESWSFNEAAGQFLECLHDQMRRKELPAVARTWRSLCRGITKLPHYQESIVSLTKILAGKVLKVLALAGMVPSTLDFATAWQNLMAIVERCSMLDRAIDDMKSANVGIYVPDAGTEYSTESMYDVNDTHGTQPPGESQPIALTCELGIHKIREESGDGSPQIMLKAGVQMTATLLGKAWEL